MREISDPRIVSESEFQAQAPSFIDGIKVLAISRVEPGSTEFGTYPAGIALTSIRGEFSTHLIVWQVTENRFTLGSGHYGIATREEAEIDAASRTLA
ncbi:Uncharacterised protein (plasmid) [Tsukamurella tyrosinosolvens]|uniref:hypothetical protein n=1 Tax=Tsukamurella tyrosinosolvens TaxID=57704 RepID=UPI000794A5C2|nr:hypothetical protein [Tsukamurella tyrosinosolvens]KXO90617.1 hypothetical protein AXK58_22875 [Tsukamurella tyrosinosolvens]VEH90301.1 Uncharacterised protein [Tsukamurella tyrosinosolvens]